MSQWQGLLGFDPKTGSGWLPPSERHGDAARLTIADNASVPTWRDVYAKVGVPDAAGLPWLELRVLGKLGLRVQQMIGSCVGAAAGRAYYQAIVGDIACRGDRETVELCFPWATWGVGRKLGGLRGRGAGSFGAAQAQAVGEWGMLRSTDMRLPKPQQNGDWVKWTAQIETEWSWPDQWPTPIPPKDAEQYVIGERLRITSTEMLAEAIASGCPATLASMFGTTGERDRGGVLIADWDDQWPHQMSVPMYAKHDRFGRLWLIDNQWGASAHKPCPWLRKLLQREAERLQLPTITEYAGSFWINEYDMARILSNRQTECFAHSGTKGFDPKPPIDWDNVDWRGIV